MKTIIVATDFSPAAANAANYAADMAMAIKGNILLFYAYMIPVTYAEVPVAVNINDLLKDADAGLSRLKEQLVSRTNGMINISAELKEGTFFHELQVLCDKVKPYVVIMGSQGTTGAERFLFGGHTIHAMKNLQWPLLTVPRGASFSDIKKIGLACDFDKVVHSIPTEELKLLVNDFKATLHVLNTGKRTEFDPEVVFESGLLQEMIGALNPEYHFITHADIDKGILDFVEKNSIDLLIVLPKRRSLFQELLHKSHTKQFVLHSHVPVMALH